MLIGPCTVVTGGTNPDVLEDSAVRVVGAHIAAIGPLQVLGAAYPEETLWPARGRVLMPGFINTHVHLARHLARGLGLRAPAEWRRYDRTLSPEDVFWSASAALVEGLRHGVTTVCDFHRSGACPDLSLSEVVAAAARVGVRVATCYGASESRHRGRAALGLRGVARLRERDGRRRDGRLRGMVGVQARTLEGVDTMVREALDVAGGRLGVHVDLDLDLTPAERWRSRGGWRTQSMPTLWAHAESAPRGLLGELRERGDALTAVGAGSVAALVREGEVAWGTDAGVNAPPLPDPIHRLAFGAPGRGALPAAVRERRALGRPALRRGPGRDRRGLARRPAAGGLPAGHGVLRSAPSSTTCGRACCARPSRARWWAARSCSTTARW